MPVTPFHFGPGLFIKSVLSKRFSFRVFIMANVVTDVEPLYFMLTRQYPLHRFTHTYLGATLVAIGCIIVGRPICSRLTEIWNGLFEGLKIANDKIETPALILGAFAGTYSHVLLDSLMHRDLRPFYPWNSSNGLLHALSYEQIHLFCVLAGLGGLLICLMTKKRRGL